MTPWNLVVLKINLIAILLHIIIITILKLYNYLKYVKQYNCELNICFKEE